MNRARLGTEPNEQRQRSEKDFDNNANDAHYHALVLIAKPGCSGRIDIGHRDKHKEHDADLMHLAARYLGGIAMPELMQRLDCRVDEPQHEEVLRRQRPIDNVFGEVRPVHAGQDDAHSDHHEPKRGPEPTEQGPHQEQSPIEKTVGIE